MCVYMFSVMWASRWHRGEAPTCQHRRCRRPGFDPSVWKIPWRRKWQPTPVFLPGKSHGQRNLAGYSPFGRKESGTTEHARTSNEKGVWVMRCQQKHSTFGEIFCCMKFKNSVKWTFIHLP